MLSKECVPERQSFTSPRAAKSMRHYDPLPVKGEGVFSRIMGHLRGEAQRARRESLVDGERFEIGTRGYDAVIPLDFHSAFNVAWMMS